MILYVDWAKNGERQLIWVMK